MEALARYEDWHQTGGVHPGVVAFVGYGQLTLTWFERDRLDHSNYTSRKERKNQGRCGGAFALYL
jgi:hypothetical protein